MPRTHRLILKSCILVLALLCAPPPYDSWTHWSLMACFVASLVYSDFYPVSQENRRNRAALLFCGLLAGGLRAFLPVLHIDEGFNVFALGPHFEIFERQLPSEVYQIFRSKFLSAYPESKWCTPEQGGFCWRAEHTPSSLFAFAPESVWTGGAPRSRLSDGIDFTNLESLRGAFANSLGYQKENLNWANSVTDVPREHLPFFVSYRMDHRMTGGRLCWQGTALWVGDDNTFRNEPHSENKCVELDPWRLKATIYGESISIKESLSMHLVPENRWRIFKAISFFLEILSLFLLLKVFVHIRWRRLGELALLASLAAIGLAAVGYLTKFGQTVIFQGGDDGLVHYGYGRAAFQYFVEGSYAEGLRAGESVFYFMPGLRYFRAIEMLFFGATNLGYLSIVLIYPMLILQLSRKFRLSVFSSWLTALIFAAGLSPGFVGFEAVIGYAETLGYFLFYSGLLFSFRAIRAESEREQIYFSFLSGFLFAISSVVRPNVAIGGAFACAMLAYSLLRQRRYRSVMAALGGFAFTGICLFHNYYFGGRFVPFVIVDPQNLGNPLSNFLLAPVEAFTSGLHGPAVASVLRQLSTWSRPFGVFAILPIATSIMAYREREFLKSDACSRTLGAAALGLQLTLLVYRPGGRYGHLAWTLTVLLAVRLAEARWGKANTWLSKFANRRRMATLGR